MNTPRCIGFIMDGNRRWARERSLSVGKGHAAGKAKAREVISWLENTETTHAIFYTFSSENWQRDTKEVAHLIQLLKEFLTKDMAELMEKNIRVRFIGDQSRFPKNIQSAMAHAEERTKNNSGGTIALALSYGGRDEITHVVQSLIEDPPKRGVQEKDIEKHLWTSGIPDPDLIIRTGGEKRLSNFLPWQSVYSELAFLDTYWPDFSKEELDDALQWYARQERRNGA